MSSRHSISLLALLVALAPTCSRPASGGPAQTTKTEVCNLTAEELEIYSLAIQELLLKDREDTARVVIREKTSTGYPPGMASMKSSTGEERELLSSINTETRSDFDARNKTSCMLDPHIEPAGRIQVLSLREEFASFPRGSGSWKAFYKKYPGATGFTLLSRIGFNSNHEQALVYLGNSCELLCGHGTLVVLNKHKGKWKIAKQASIWKAG